MSRTIMRIASPFLVALLVTVLLVVVFRIPSADATETSISVVNATTGTRETVFPSTVFINETFAVNITVANALLLAGWQVNLAWDGEIIKINDTIEVTIPSDNVFGTYADPTGLNVTGKNMFLACTIRTSAPFKHVNVTQSTLCQVRFTIIQNDTRPLSTVLHLVQEAENLICTKLVDVNASEISYTPVDGAYEMLPEGTVIVPVDYSSIQEAINGAGEESIIFVRSGTYYENIVVNKTLYLYGESTETTIVDGGYAGDVVRIATHNITINHFTIRKSGTTQNPPNIGLLLDHVQNFTANQNRIVDNVIGMRLDNSSSSYVSGSFISNNLDGISLNWSSDIVMTQNDIVANQRYGIYVNGSSGSILENTIKSNSLGLMLYHSSGNKVYHNNFVENQQNAYTHESYNNLWDHSYPSGGNYWSGYAGFDLRRGSYQNETESDGIGDTPYLIDPDNIDKYPLMKKYPWSTHDVGVTSVTTSKTVVGQGNNLLISVMIMNYGLYTETFNVTVYANATSIQTQNVILNSLDSVTVAFAWNTSGFARAYIISVDSTQVAGETELIDNTFVHGIVKVSCIGDINGDYAAEAKDFVLVKKAIPSTPGSPKWNSNADVNDDLAVDAKDFQIVKNHIPSLLEP